MSAPTFGPGALTSRERAILQLVILLFDVLDREGLQPLSETSIAIGVSAANQADLVHRDLLLIVRAALERLQTERDAPAGPALTVIEGGLEG